MANYNDIGVADVGFLAATNLSLMQYYFVIPGSVAGEVASATGASNPTPFGILQNAPSAGQEARVRVFGFSKLFCKTTSTCGIAYGRYITSNACGQGIAQETESGSIVLARNFDTAAPVSASRFLKVFVNCAGVSPCAVSAS